LGQLFFSFGGGYIVNLKNPNNIERYILLTWSKFARELLELP